MKARLPTQKSIAEAIGVSRETISHILNGRQLHRYSAETRQKVLKAVKDFDYHPNKAAQMISRGRSNLIGIVHFGMFYQAARKAGFYLPQLINSNGYNTFVVDLSWHGESHCEAIRQLVEMRVEGVIILQQAKSFGFEEVEILANAGIPAVSMAGNEQFGIPAVTGDSTAIFTEMVRHLHAIGHRSMLLLANTYDSRPTLNRIAGFKAGIAQFPDIQAGIVRLSAEQGPFDPSHMVYAHVKKLLKTNALPDAILCSNDQWTRGAFSACLESGLKIPEDIAITGFDNDTFGAYAPYYLTTGEPDIMSESAKTVELLTDLVENRPVAQRHHDFPCQMVVRRSCGAALGALATI